MSKLNVTAEAGSHIVVMTREFKAPRELVFRAMTEPALVAQWWGLNSYTTTVDKLEAKPGGIWRFVQNNEQGEEHAFHGFFHELNAPSRLVYTFEYEGMPGHILLETVTLEEKDGKTLMTDSAVFQSVEDRDGMIASGMEYGAEEGWKRLDDVLLKELA